MATLVLQAAGAAIGSFLGGPLGAAIGQAAGAIAGNAIDAQLFGQQGANRVGPRLTGTPIVGASEGAPIPKVYGRARIGGNVIWMTRFEEHAVISKSGGSGGKGGGSRTTTFRYHANFAVGLCEGPIAGVRRIWADGKELDQSEITIRVYRGNEEQDADPLIVAKEGVGNAPCYRGLAYVVFERMPLEDFGNRLPVLSFEVIRPIEPLADKVTAVCLIPGSSEYGYDPVATLQYLRPGVTRSENRHQLFGDSDWNASLDNLQAICPNLQSVALVVTWFGNDLRAGSCSIRPRVEISDKTTSGSPWSVAGLNRATAQIVSQYEDKPAFGGTPSDDAIVRAIQDLRERGLKVVFYPFVMMDIPAGNALDDPWTGSGAQPAYPWRGRITCDPAPGRSGSPDGTAAAGDQVDSFFGTDIPGEAEWSFRRFILHYANLCESAGGVDTFLIGSELAALTRVRSGPGQYPAAIHLAQLASDAAAALRPGTTVSYAADWTEYGAHVLDNGAEVRFPLDVLWSHPDVHFVGLDCYWPLSDWRDDAGHLDGELAVSIYDRSYLQSRMTAGEGFDWYYPDAASRDAQDRAPITDGAFGKPWVFRPKDLQGWWSNTHFERVNGQELAQPTGWIPQSKPIWLTEIGCPAVDKGANASNVFPDPKSSENAIPYYSRGHRDDLIQLRTVEAIIDHFSPATPGFSENSNPISPVYGGRMVAADNTHVWAWDARPFPAFPALLDTWADGGAWETGHWLNGRLEACSLDELVRTIASEMPGLEPLEIACSMGSATDGYIVERPMSARSAIEPLAMFFGFDVHFSAGKLIFSDRAIGETVTVGIGDLAVNEHSAPFEFVRAQETELSRSVSVTVYDGQNDYRLATVQSRRLDGRSRRESHFEISIVTSIDEAKRRSEIYLHDLWAGREQGALLLPPSRIAIDNGDRLQIDTGAGSRLYLINRIDDSPMREVHVRSLDRSVFDHAPHVASRFNAQRPAIPGPAEVRVLELAVARNAAPPLLYVAAFADPWPGGLAIWKASGSASFVYDGMIPAAARMGVTVEPFGPGPVGRFDLANALVIDLFYGALASLDIPTALSGNPALAVQGTDGRWEIVNYSQAELVAGHRYRLSGLVRGLGGEEHLAGRFLPAGAPVVVLDDAVVALTREQDDINVPRTFRIAPLRRDHADPSAVEFSATATPVAFRPYAPVHAHAARTPAGIEIAFLRRSRLNSDSWEIAAVPVSEATEAYEIEILSGGIPVRLLTSTTPSVVYASADEIADFGTQQGMIEVRVFQMSQIAGRGFPLTVELAVE
jgi:hypothetical protein